MNWYLGIRGMPEPAAAWIDGIDTHLAWLHGMHDRGSIVMSGLEVIEWQLHQIVGIGAATMRSGHHGFANRQLAAPS